MVPTALSAAKLWDACRDDVLHRYLLSKPRCRPRPARNIAIGRFRRCITESRDRILDFRLS